MTKTASKFACTKTRSQIRSEDVCFYPPMKRSLKDEIVSDNEWKPKFPPGRRFGGHPVLRVGGRR